MKVVNTFYITRNTIRTQVTPHYKSLKKQYKKESNQMFFRESIDGSITLWGSDYNIVNNASIEDELTFDIYQNGSLYSTNKFYKSDCEFDHFKKSVTIKLSPKDKYSAILEKYENTYDLLKLKPEITKIQLTKRGYIQVYVPGDTVITNIFGGTYWESEVSEPITDENRLQNTYLFGQGTTFKEVHLEGFNIPINATYALVRGADTASSYCWYPDATSGIGYICEIYMYQTSAFTGDTIYDLATDQVAEVVPETVSSKDAWYIEIWVNESMRAYRSKKLYNSNNVFLMTAGQEKYEMEARSSYFVPNPETFFLGPNIITYHIHSRLIYDAEDWGLLQTIDDFAIPKGGNFNNAVPLIITGSTTAARVYQSQGSSSTPTAYGKNDYGRYFTPPSNSFANNFIPIARSTWANTSLWIALADAGTSEGGFEGWIARFYRKYLLNDAYHLSEVIRVLLEQIDPTVSHEYSTVYSEYIYGNEGSEILGGCEPFITAKSNILKGEYDQAAQKAEITFKQVMDMLRDCFRCYWFIDSQNRFRIEHVKYFMNGMSYSGDTPETSIDLTSKYDKFNKKKALYDQKAISYEKSDLNSRYEFNWAEDVTDIMGNIQIDINSNYVQKDNIAEINIAEFNPDIDFMLMAPDRFSMDGFALIMATVSGNSIPSVPIERHVLVNEKQYNRNYGIYAQNWYASFNNLVKTYMFDMPSRLISYTNLPSGTLNVSDVKRSMEQKVQYQAEEDPIYYQLAKTDIGFGYIKEVSVNIDTRLITLTLAYTPQ